MKDWEALKAVHEGKRVRHPKSDREYYYAVEGLFGAVYATVDTGAGYCEWPVGMDFTDGWEEVPPTPPEPTHSFYVALRACQEHENWTMERIPSGGGLLEYSFSFCGIWRNTETREPGVLEEEDVTSEWVVRDSRGKAIAYEIVHDVRIGPKT